MEILASIPSPGGSEIELGPFPLRGYAVCIIIGVFLAIWLGGRRWVARGGRVGTVADVAVWAVPFGLVGARIYHVATDYQLYFGEGEEPIDALKIWDGGIGIWGAIAGGALGAWIACRRRGIPLPAFADAVAPGIALAQAAGRWGNWFNQELYGRPTDLPWALEIDEPKHSGSFAGDPGPFHPTFLYESLWCIGLAALVIWADRRFRMGHGRAFALYVAGYTAGRFWIEYLRIDDAHEIFGLRLNNWTSLLVFAAAVAYIVVSARLRPGREAEVEPVPADGPAADDEAAAAAEPGTAVAAGGTGQDGGRGPEDRDGAAASGGTGGDDGPGGDGGTGPDGGDAPAGAADGAADGPAGREAAGSGTAAEGGAARRGEAGD